MKIPANLKIGAHNVKVLYPYYFRENPDLGGQADYQNGEIRVSDRSSDGGIKLESDIAVIFLHEIIHWVCHVYNGECSLGEKETCALSQGLLQVICDNNLDFIGNDNENI